MSRLLRWLRTAVVVLLVLGLAAGALLYIQSERILRRTYAIPTVSIQVPSDEAAIAEGRRLAITHGCYRGCHGEEAEGTVFFDQPVIARLIAPDLTASVRHYTDAQLAVIVRNGVRPDGHSMLVMPSEAFATLTDEDLGRILAFLHSLPPVDGPGPGNSIGPLGRLGLVVGEFKTAAELTAEVVPPPEAASEEAAYGRNLARTTCAQCHGSSLTGASNPDFTSPDLRVVTAYPRDAFTELLRTGVALGGRELPNMGPWARRNLALLTDQEIAALYSYLHTFGDATQAASN